jgi:hypothetical protein
MTENFLSTKKAIIPPTNGWKPQSYYKVKVSLNANNPIHESIFYSGFLHEGEPAGYSQVWNPTYDNAIPTEGIFHMEVICELVCTDS